MAGALAMPVLLGLAGAASFRSAPLRTALTQPAPALWLMVVFVVWAATSTFWAPAPDLEQAAKLLAVTLFGVLFVSASASDPGMRRLSGSAAPAACLVLILMLGLEAALNMPMTRLAEPGLEDWQTASIPGRGATILAAVLWGGAGALLLKPSHLRAFIAVAMLVGGAIAGAQFFHTANGVALALGTAAFGLGWLAPGLMVRVVAAMLALWLAAAPVTYPLLFSSETLADSLPFSWAARVEAWNYVAAGVMEQPWIGHGLGAARADDATMLLRGVETSVIQTHPHSASLQIWFETGLVGAALGAGALTLGGKALGRLCAGNRPAGAAIAASFAALGFIANMSYSIWQEWWNAALFIAAAVCCPLLTPKGEETR